MIEDVGSCRAIGKADAGKSFDGWRCSCHKEGTKFPASEDVDLTWTYREDLGAY